jgi:hypothetical protein
MVSFTTTIIVNRRIRARISNVGMFRFVYMILSWDIDMDIDGGYMDKMSEIIDSVVKDKVIIIEI